MVVVAPRVINRFGFKTPIVAALLLLAAGMAVLSLVRADGSFAVDVLPASLIAAAGMALAFIPSLGTAISVGQARGRRPRVRHRQHQLPGRLGARPGRHDRARHVQGADQMGDVAALTDGYSAAFLGAAGVALAGALLSAGLLRFPKTPAASTVTDTEREPLAA